MKVAVVSDSHYGCRNDNQVFMNQTRKFYEEEFFPTLEDRGINTIIHMGDVVDRRKYINWKTLYQMRDIFFDRCAEKNIDLHVIIGNHDVFYKNTNIVNSMDGLRLETNDQFHIYEEATEIELDGTKFFLQPWICDENREHSIKAMEETSAQILFGHLEIKGFEMHTGQYSQEGVDASMFKKFDMAFSGHFHHKSDNGNIYYLGTQYQITWSDYNDKKGFHIFDTETRELEFIVNPHEMFHKIYYDEDNMTLESIQEMDVTLFKDCYIKVIIVKRKNPFWFDTLIDRLYKVDVADISIAENFDLDVLEGEEAIDEAEDTITILSKYVNSLELENKKELDTLMKSLYTESLTVETI